MKLLEAFTAFCWAYVAWVQWKLANDLDQDEKERDLLSKSFAANPSDDTLVLLTGVCERIDRKKQQLSIAGFRVDNAGKGTDLPVQGRNP